MPCVEFSPPLATFNLQGHCPDDSSQTSIDDPLGLQLHAKMGKKWFSDIAMTSDYNTQIDLREVRAKAPQGEAIHHIPIYFEQISIFDHLSP